jgi:ABC-type Zn uptake system ZnuABC Zn-binding protein ZnuA
MPGKLLKILIPMVAGVLLLAIACSSEEPAAEPATQSAAQPAASDSPAAAQPTASASSAPAAAQPAAAAQTQQTTPAQTTSTAPAQTRNRAPEVEAEKLHVVTTSNIVADWVKAVGQDRVEVFALLPANADPHSYQPGAQDIAQVADADLVLSVGLSLERSWLTDLVENAARDRDAVVELGEEVDPIDFVEMFEDHDDHDDHDGHHDEHGDHDSHDDHGEETTLLGKLLIGDGETGAMSIIELDHGHVEQNAFDMGSRAGRIYATRSGRFAIAVASDANMVHIIDGGTYLEPHEGHFDLHSGEAELVGLDLSGDRPVHLAVGDEWAAVYYDGSGDVALIEEHELEEEGAAYQPVVLNIGPHHGAAVPLEDDLFAITPQHPDYASNPEQYRLPVTVDIMNLSGEVLYSAGDCPSLHGDAGNGHMAVFGCEGGVLVVEADHGHFHHDFIPAPDGEPEDFRLTTVWGASGTDHFMAMGSQVGLYLIEPEDGEMFQLIDAEEGNSPIQAAFTRDGEHAVVVMSTGEILLYDLHDGDVIASNSDALATPVETGFWGRPHIAMAPGAIFITDSVRGEVMQLDDHDLDEVNHWDIDGKPTKIAFVGIHGETEGHMEAGHDEHGHEDHGHEDHGHEEAGHDDHGHGHHDHHGHDHGEHDPHFWFDPIRVQKAVNSIAAHLSGLDPASQTFYRDNAAEYNHELDELHHWIEDEVAVLSHEQRLIVTNHDAYQYFAQLYDFEIVGAIIPSATTEVEASAQDLAELVEAIEHSGAKAVFAEMQHSDRLARQIANETGAELVGTLYTGSLGEKGGEAGNYLDFMRYNVSTIVEALH